MFIDEQDLFYFVNYPEKLPDIKKKYIEDYLELYKDEIDFLQGTPKFEDSLLSEELEFNMHLSLIGKNPKQVINFRAVTSTPTQKNQIRTLAADSSIDINSPKSKTLTDETGSYLIKVISINDKTNIYTFTSNNEELNNFSLFLKPSGGIHHLLSNKSPLTLDFYPPIENLDLILF